ncbi:hypothetical protein P3T37_006714 [Kitasatospora sp. MAA4]|uniref:hypothetical protein n=1 Tax=Kitasatospora sp. MAA4 TaxID=3035093 RepID=UPI0024770154|nr:hypothetical protein [Kitasatospora sp. MAA4]MDH6137282.1 hypothetical protein [Kitasatospora sp. MAA4]
MSSPQSPTRSQGADPAATLLGCDRLELAAGAGRAALARSERLGRPTGPVLQATAAQTGERWLYLLAEGTAELVPGLLHWLGWGPELGLDLAARPALPQRPATVPRPRGAEEDPPRPVTDGHALCRVRWVRARSAAGPPLGLDLASPALLRLLDGLAEACLRDRLGLPPAR